jgi:hypothetical protein
MLSVLALLVGEALLLGGLWWAFPPLALIAAGLQVVAVSLVRESKAAKA